MGGNARYINRENGEDLGFAEKIDLSKIERTLLVQEVTQSLNTLNNKFYETFNILLWNDFNVIKTGKGLNGSSNALFNLQISDTDFKMLKPFVGDIDVTFPKEHIEKLWNLLNDLENTKLSEMITYLGHKNSNIDKNKAKNLNQINGVFLLKTDKYETNIQIDFEASEYTDNKPTDWASFSHNSDWEDIKQGYKGVMHKYTLINLSRASSKLYGVDIVTKSQIKKITNVSSEKFDPSSIKVSTNKAYKNPTNLAFSVDRGIRTKFKQLLHSDGIPAQINGNFIYTEIDTNDSSYETNMNNIFKMIFKKIPNDNELKLFNSFVGVLKLMKEYLDDDTVKEFFKNHLITKSLFAPTAQGLERNNPEEDSNIKDKMINKIYNEFPFLDIYKPYVEEQKIKYYKTYKMYDVTSEKKESFSDIFKSIDK